MSNVTFSGPWAIIDIGHGCPVTPRGTLDSESEWSLYQMSAQVKPHDHATCASFTCSADVTILFGSYAHRYVT